jgi:hypothetical protein
MQAMYALGAARRKAAQGTFTDVPQHVSQHDRGRDRQWVNAEYKKRAAAYTMAAREQGECAYVE